MIIRSIHLKNFRLHADSQIPLDRGLTGLMGTNGEGKSSVLEALTWCLFGAKALRGSKGGIRWNGAPARHVAEVEIVFELGFQTYRLWRSEGDARLYEGDLPRPIAESTSGVDERIPDLLKMDLGQFRSTFLCAQKELSRIGDMKGSPRRQFFENVMGIGQIMDAQAELRERKNALKNERAGMALGLGQREPLEQELADATSAADTGRVSVECRLIEERAADQSLAAASAVASDSARLAGQHAELTTKRNQAELERQRLEKDISKFSTRLTAAVESKSSADSIQQQLQLLPSLRSERDRTREALLRQRRRSELTAEIATKEKEIATMQASVTDAQQKISAHDPDRLEQVRARLAAIDTELVRLEQSRTNRREAALARRGELQKQYATTERKIAAIRGAGESGACPTCVRALGEAFDTVVATLEVLLEDLEHQRESASIEAEDCQRVSDDEFALGSEREPLDEEVRARIKQEFAAEQAKVTLRLKTAEMEKAKATLTQLTSKRDELPAEAVTVAESSLVAIQQNIDRLEKLERDPKYLEARRVAGQIPELEQELLQARTNLSAAVKAVAEFEEHLAELALDFDAEVHAANLVAVEVERKSHAAAQEKLIAAQAELKAAEERVRRAETAIADYDRRGASLRALELTIADYEAADARLSDFRLEQAATIRPEMEELTSGLVAVLTDGRFESCSINDDFEVTLQRNGQDQEVISGGEEDVVALAQRIAVSQMISERAGHALSLLILDEPFGHFDRVRLANALNLIRRLKGTFEQVLVISHLEEVKESVDRTITVTLDAEAGRSRVQQDATAEVIHA